MNYEKESVYWKEFHECLDRLGIGKGDILYVGSDIAAVVVLANRELEFKGREDRDIFLNHLVDAVKEHVEVGG